MGLPKIGLAAIGVFCVGFVSGGWVVNEVAQAKIQEMVQAHEKQYRESVETHSRQMAEATDALMQARDDYDVVRAERDGALDRLRDNARSGTRPTDTVETLGRRIAHCQRMVVELAEAGSKCSDGWQRCAEKHDALVKLLDKVKTQ